MIYVGVKLMCVCVCVCGCGCGCGCDSLSGVVRDLQKDPPHTRIVTFPVMSLVLHNTLPPFSSTITSSQSVLLLSLTS